MHTGTYNRFRFYWNKQFYCDSFERRLINTSFDEFSFYVMSYQFDMVVICIILFSNLVRADKDVMGAGIGLYVKSSIMF